MSAIGEERMPMEPPLVEDCPGNVGLTWEGFRDRRSSTPSNAASGSVVATTSGSTGRSSAARAGPPISAGA
jgi:hypothetical protein